jgi:purine-binding chemotaxis protein CheW
MVDLVKIRKKAKKKDEESAGAPPAAATADPIPAPAQRTEKTEASAAAQEPKGQSPEPDARKPEARSLKPDASSPKPEASPAAPSKLDRFKAEAGKRRDTQVVQHEEAEAQLELLTFVIAGEHYAIDIERIVEIVTPRAVTRIPNADPSVVGIISLRGTIVTLVDVRRRLHHPGLAETTEDTRIIVIDFQREVVGFVVDLVLRVVKTTAAAIEPPPVVHTSELTESIRGVFQANAALTILLDLDKLLDHSGLAATTA